MHFFLKFCKNCNFAIFHFQVQDLDLYNISVNHNTVLRRNNFFITVFFSSPQMYQISIVSMPAVKAKYIRNNHYIIYILYLPISHIVANDILTILSLSWLPSLPIATNGYTRDEESLLGATWAIFRINLMACILSTSLSRQTSTDLKITLTVMSYSIINLYVKH